jgi:hypothetical protein
MSRKSQLEFIKKKITKDNILMIFDIFANMFEYGLIPKLIYDSNEKNPKVSSISIIYASDLIYDKYSADIIEILKIIYPNIKHTGSYKMMEQHSKIYYYALQS